ncbi:DoxX family protein [Candidatus Gracilibacteria bacterium 28_42_T64]|nr:DoxX family protein [Candidatus Gracilibacteria bacterium 28_42_T64]
MSFKTLSYKFFDTDDKDYGLLILRVTLGIVMFAHGGQKLFGLFGGNGFEGTMGFFTGVMGMPYIIALLVVLGESLGALAMIVGFKTRFMAFGILVIMIGAAFMAHLQYGFYIDWFGNQEGNGIEYHILAGAMALVLMLRGGGTFALDSVMKKWFK